MVRNILSGAVLTSLMGCSSYAPMETVDYVDLPRFMGDWYVVANIPTFVERGAHNAVESYRLNEDKTIETTFTFRQNSFDGEEKTYHPTGYVVNNNTNAVWGMQFFWPIKADYRIVYLKPDYSLTVIGRLKRDYVWIMAREPRIEQQDFEAILRLLGEQGYDTSLIQKVPQKWD
ncbi:MAG: hypothetical protein EP297_07985 [Gammaproteobacteria bacterium]|nr:MAG: hypothetical protein EP297_07985 [Gammaproteobacteria bacterium]